MFATQKLATREAVISTFKSFNVSYDPKKSCREIVDGNKSIKDAIVGRLVEMIEKGEMPLDSKQEDNKKYCVGLLNNWLRRDEALNGGVKYQGKVGNSDPAIREARKLLNSVTDESVKATIQATIDEMVAAKKKESAPTIDIDKLPESLKKFVA